MRDISKSAKSVLLCLAALLVSASVRGQDPAFPDGCTQTAAPTAIEVRLDDGDGIFNDSLDQPIGGLTVVQNGSRVWYRVRLFQNQNDICAFSGGSIAITLPNNTVVDVTPTLGVPIICGASACATDPDPPAGSVVPEVWSKPAEYIVNLAHDGSDPDGLANGRLQARGAYTGGYSYYDVDGELATGSATISLEPTVACVKVTKLVACKQAGGSCQTFGASATGYVLGEQDPTFCYSITLSNCSTKAFAITSLSDDKFGDLIDELTAVLPSLTLAKGAKATITIEADHANTTVNEVTVQGVTDTNPPLPASDKASATANVQLAAVSCEVSANPSVVTAGTTTAVTYTVTIKNLGDAALNTIAVTDDRCGTVGNIASLNGGSQTTIQCTANLIVSADCTGAPYRNNVAVTSQTGGQCPVQPSSDCYVDVGCTSTPEVKLIKKVTCFDAPNCQSPFGDVAYGVKTDTQCPAFCYQITITNSGPVVLTDVVVTDPDLDLSECNFPTSLAVGEAQTCVISAVERCASLKNTATVTAQGGTPVQVVSSTDNADVFIKKAAITCVKEVSTDGVKYANRVEIPEDGQAHDVWYRITVSNVSDAGVVLGNIVVADEMLSGCDIAGQVPETLASGDSFVVNCTVSQTCTGPDILNTATVSAEVVAAESVKCVKDWEGKTMTVSHECSAAVGCTPVARPGCRTTGGGKQYTSENQTCPTNVRYVTHGGQVGAPFGAAGAPTITNCETGEGTGFWNPCIRGEYQHVRHMKGGRRANFHAASNGNVNQFDSLACACLPCDSFDTTNSWPNPKLTCHPADRTYTSNGDVTSVEGLCNPGDRACGPEPRKAPANKIAFSGVGDYTDAKGRKIADQVVFRVDIEDRGEPGNAHAIGSNGKDKKIDRYRIRMWKITGDPDSLYNRALRVAVAVTNAADERVLAELPCGQGATPEPDVDDGGDLDRGNRQIHPNTGAICN